MNGLILVCSRAVFLAYAIPVYVIRRPRESRFMVKVLKFGTLFFLCSSKILVVRAGIHKMPFWQATSVRNFRTFTVCFAIKIYKN